jgi:membrane protein YdbS with pleckstrin-like domain
MAEIARYLLPSERHALEVRRHWASLAGNAATTAAFWVGGLIALWLFQDVALLRITCVFFLLFSLAWFGWMVGEWQLERFVVTDRRVLLLTGILTKRIAIMPLAKVTDLTYERTVLGRVLGYGVFIIESAGQQQALSRIDFIPHPDQLYLQVSGLLFGTQSEDDGTGSTGGPGQPPPDYDHYPPGIGGEQGYEPAHAQRLAETQTEDPGLPAWETPQSAQRRSVAPTAPLPYVP